MQKICSLGLVPHVMSNHSAGGLKSCQIGSESCCVILIKKYIWNLGGSDTPTSKLRWVLPSQFPLPRHARLLPPLRARPCKCKPPEFMTTPYQGLQASDFSHLSYNKKLVNFNDWTKWLGVTIVIAKLFSGTMAIKNNLVHPINECY